MRLGRRGLVATGCAIGACARALASRRAARLSGAVTFAPDSTALDAFLAAPGHVAMEAMLRFDADCPDDVMAFADVEWLEGVTAPRHVAGGDWMAFAGVQRSGAVRVATGSEAQRAGTPSQDRDWRILDLGRRLEAETWYRLRITADFGRRRFLGAEVEGPGLRRVFDLIGVPLDYPNMMPFDQAGLIASVGAMRGHAMMGRAGTPIVDFDDVSLTAITPAGTVPLFRDGFERQAVISAQPPPTIPIRLDAYDRGRWYKEREEALFRPRMVSFAHSGTRVGTADARLG